MKRSLAIIALCALFNGFLAADATIGNVILQANVRRIQ